VELIADNYQGVSKLGKSGFGGGVGWMEQKEGGGKRGNCVDGANQRKKDEGKKNRGGGRLYLRS